MESLIKDQWAALGEVDTRHGIKLVIDEWGSWHPAGTEINKRHLFEQMGTLRDALVAALSLDTFNRHAEKVDMANVAQLVNNLHSLFLADGDKFVATPTFYVYTMYRTHHGAKAVRIVTEAPEVTFKAGGADQQIFRLAGSASTNGSGAATVTLVHTHATEPAEVVVRLKGGTVGQVQHTVLTHDQLNAHNTFAEPANLIPKPNATAPRGAGEEIRCLLPAHSVNRLDIQLARSTGAASS
jgi:alpha-N-arabinofuranosidase